jgi:O-acetyl-ADP-ribose deacetylase (regulator of RNase III)
MKGIVIGSEDLANRVHIRGSDRSWPIPPNVPVEGKSPHIASVVESIRETQGTDRVPEPHHILLIDDDKKNIKQAQRVGFKAVAFPELPLPGIHMNSLPEGRGLNVVYRSQLRHGTLLCISSGSVVSFDGGAKGCIVNAANEDGLGGGGVDGAISQAGGRELYSDRLALTVENIEGREVRIPTGTAKITGPRRYGSLRVPCVIHAVGPCYQEFERDESTLAVGDKLLVDAYISSMDLARRSNIELLAFSLLSAGVFRGSRSLEHVLEIAVRATVRKVYEGLREVHLVAFSNTEIECLLSIVRRLENNHDDQILGAGQSTEIIQFLEDLNLMCTTTFH